jgi:magnesium chelatase family protein
VLQGRVEAARQVQRERFSGQPAGVSPIACNADMRLAEVSKFCGLDDAGRALMKTAMVQLQLSARAYHRVLKLARTIADLAGAAEIAPNHLVSPSLG